MISDQAIVHPNANIGCNVSIAPFSIIEEDVVIGKGTTIGAYTIIRNGSVIGEDNHIFHYCSIGEDPQSTGFQGEKTKLVIGNDNVIREYTSINRGTTETDVATTLIGDNNFIMGYIHIAHDCKIGNNTILANNVSLAGHVAVEDHAFLGGFTLVHQFCRMGQQCMTGISTVCKADVLPYSIVRGIPGKLEGCNKIGLKRRGVDQQCIRILQGALTQLKKNNSKPINSKKSVFDELMASADRFNEVQVLVDFLDDSQSKRGYIR